MTEFVAAAHFKNRIVFLKDMNIKEPHEDACKRAWFVAKNKEENYDNTIDLSYAYINVIKKKVTYHPDIMTSLNIS